MSPEIWIRVDVRGAGLAASSATLCAAAIEQAVWAERNDLAAISFAEHHGTADGYLPSPVVLAAAVAARTERIRLHLGALVLPLHNPLRVAEDVCVLDNISNGRVDATIGVGYVPSEFAMFDVDLKQRGPLVEEAIAALRGAFSGMPFMYRGRQVRVGPAPVQPGGPKLIVSGTIMASALRAARLGDGFWPMYSSQEQIDCYRAECARLGKPVGRIIDMASLWSFHVSHDPERDWARIGPHLLHETNEYGRMAKSGDTSYSYFDGIKDVETLKASGVYGILTPDECLAFLSEQRAAGKSVWFNPLCGGIHPDIAWESLELLASDVLPRLKKRDPVS